jgi:hypothetical protein
MMTVQAARRAEQTLQAACLLAAPALFTASTFFWREVDGRTEYGAVGGTLVALGSVCWIPALQALFGLVREPMPRFAAWGWFAAVYGVFGGMAFGLEGLFADAFHLPHDIRQAAWAERPTLFNLSLFWPGPLFPLSLIALGLVFLRTRAVPVWTAVLIALAGVAFPVSRIPRLAIVAHAADLLMLVPMGYVALRKWKSLST